MRAKLAGFEVQALAGSDTFLDSRGGRSVAATAWKVAIPPGEVAPTNADVDLTQIDDIILRVEHSPISLSDSPVDYTPVCGA